MVVRLLGHDPTLRPICPVPDSNMFLNVIFNFSCVFRTTDANRADSSSEDDDAYQTPSVEDVTFFSNKLKSSPVKTKRLVERPDYKFATPGQRGECRYEMIGGDDLLCLIYEHIPDIFRCLNPQCQCFAPYF